MEGMKSILYINNAENEKCFFYTFKVILIHLKSLGHQLSADDFSRSATGCILLLSEDDRNNFYLELQLLSKLLLYHAHFFLNICSRSFPVE